MDRQIKLVALDIDGTLLDDQGNISENTKLKLKEIVKKGIFVVLATGRSNIAAMGIRERLALDLPIISFNGSTIFNGRDRKILENKISLEDALKIIKYCEELGLYIKIFIDDMMYIDEESESTKKFAEYQKLDYRVVGKLSEFVKKDVNMILSVYKQLPEDDVDFIFKDLNITTARSTPYVIEFMAKGSTKGRSLELLANHLGIKKENILAAGNALNDLEMLEYAGTGIAMKNSDFNLLERWDVISQYSNNEEGVYNIIKDL